MRKHLVTLLCIITLLGTTSTYASSKEARQRQLACVLFFSATIMTINSILLASPFFPENERLADIQEKTSCDQHIVDHWSQKRSQGALTGNFQLSATFSNLPTVECIKRSNALEICSDYYRRLAEMRSNSCSNKAVEKELKRGCPDSERLITNSRCNIDRKKHTQLANKLRSTPIKSWFDLPGVDQQRSYSVDTYVVDTVIFERTRFASGHYQLALPCNALGGDLYVNNHCSEFERTVRGESLPHQIFEYGADNAFKKSYIVPLKTLLGSRVKAFYRLVFSDYSLGVTHWKNGRISYG
ncbi:MAG: hypothetical protein WCK42_07160 [Myxococcaceae bacterium]